MRQNVSVSVFAGSQNGYSCTLLPSVESEARPDESTERFRYFDWYAAPLKRTRWFHIASNPSCGIGNGKPACAPSIERPSFVVFAVVAALTVLSSTYCGNVTVRCVGY